MKKIAVFVSGGGSNFRAIHRQTIQGNILGKIVMVFSNNPNCGAIKFAEGNSIPIFIINAVRYPNPHTRVETLMIRILANLSFLLNNGAGYCKA